ncbi:MAG: zinc ABC transporter substrate-binding protein [Thermodesulfobacteriota bacterium]
MRRARPLASVLLLLGALALASCEAPGKRGGFEAAAPKDLSGRKIAVVATTGMVAELAAQVGGDRVEVRALMGPGVDPHLYKASEGDVIRMASADAVFFNGLHLEGKMAEVFERMKGRIRTFAVTDAIDREKLLRPPEFEGAYDPHVWFDVTLWMDASRAAEGAFAEMDPAHADVYRANGKRYRERLEALDRYVRERASSVPPEKRVLITAHDAFNYFGRAYGFQVRGLQGISTVSEAGAADIQALARLIAENGIPAVFVESSVPPRYIEALQEAVQARGFRVRIGGSLFSDAMGDPGTPEGSYDGMVRHNIDTIAAALSGSADPRRGGAGGGER